MPSTLGVMAITLLLGATLLLTPAMAQPAFNRNKIADFLNSAQKRAQDQQDTQGDGSDVRSTASDILDTMRDRSQDQQDPPGDGSDVRNRVNNLLIAIRGGAQGSQRGQDEEDADGDGSDLSSSASDLLDAIREQAQGEQRGDVEVTDGGNGDFRDAIADFVDSINAQLEDVKDGGITDDDSDNGWLPGPMWANFGRLFNRRGNNTKSDTNDAIRKALGLDAEEMSAAEKLSNMFERKQWPNMNRWLTQLDREDMILLLDGTDWEKLRSIMSSQDRLLYGDGLFGRNTWDRLTSLLEDSDGDLSVLMERLVDRLAGVDGEGDDCTVTRNILTRVFGRFVDWPNLKAWLDAVEEQNSVDLDIIICETDWRTMLRWSQLASSLDASFARDNWKNLQIWVEGSSGDLEALMRRLWNAFNPRDDGVEDSDVDSDVDSDAAAADECTYTVRVLDRGFDWDKWPNLKAWVDQVGEDRMQEVLCETNWADMFEYINGLSDEAIEFMDGFFGKQDFEILDGWVDRTNGNLQSIMRRVWTLRKVNGRSTDVSRASRGTPGGRRMLQA